MTAPNDCIMSDARALDPPVIVKMILSNIYFLFLGHGGQVGTSKTEPNTCI